MSSKSANLGLQKEIGIQERNLGLQKGIGIQERKDHKGMCTWCIFEYLSPYVE